MANNKQLKQQRNLGEIFEDVALRRTSTFADRIRRGGFDVLANGPVDTTMSLTDPNFAFNRSNNSYSGTDCTVVITYNQHMLVLGNLETFAYSIFKESNPVRTLGRINPKNWVEGCKTIAGSMIFVTFDEHPLYPLFQFMDQRYDKVHRFSSPLADEIPPFDMMLIFNNEYGAHSVMRFYAVSLFEEGGVYSINDIYSECTMQWKALDMDPMISAGEEGSWKQLLYQKQIEGKVVDNHFAAMLKYRSRLEKQVNNLAIEIDKLGTVSRGSVNINVRSNRLRERRQERQDLRQIMTKKENLRRSLIKEIERLDKSINSYEKTKMTWDMNSSLQHMDQSTGNIDEGLTNTVDPSVMNLRAPSIATTSKKRRLYSEPSAMNLRG